MISNIRALLRFLRCPAIRRRNCAAALASAGTLLFGLAKGASTDFTLYVANELAYNSSPFTRYYTIEQFDSLGNASVFATNSSFTNPILNAPVSVAIDSSGNIYVACANDNTWIEKFDPWGNHAARFVSPTVDYPGAMVFDSSGNLYVASGSDVTQYNSQGTGQMFASTATISQLVGLAFDASGNLYASDAYRDSIWKIDTQTNVTTFASPGHTPYALAFDSAGNLYAALEGNGEIIKYTPPATNATVVASLGEFTQPVGLVFDPAGNLYVSEFDANQIVKIDQSSNVTVFATNGLNEPCFIALQPKLYNVDRFVVAGGGGTSSGGNWTVSATAGQADAAIMAGQSFGGEIVGVEGGFWAGPISSLQGTSTNSGPPEIEISSPSLAGGQIIIPFTFLSGSPVTFELLEATNLAGPWVTNSSASLTTITSNLSYFFTWPAMGGSAFFKVQTP